MALPVSSNPVRVPNRVGSSVDTSRPDLRLVPRQVKITARRVLALALVIFLAFIGIVAFEVRIAQGQMKLDDLTKTVNLARDHYEELRQERAMLHAPDVLREAALSSGMFIAPEIKFLPVDESIVALIMETTSKMDSRFAEAPKSRLDQFGHIKGDK